MHGYYLASLLMELIERDHGFGSIVAMLEAYRDDHTTAQAIRLALEREPSDLDAAFEAFMAQRLAKPIRALSPADDALPAASGGPYQRLLKTAREAHDGGDLDAAIEALQQAQQLLPELAGSAGTYTRLSEIYELNGEREKAIEQLQLNIAIDADDLDAHVTLARLHEAAGNVDAAREVWEMAMLIQPFDVESHRRLAQLHEQDNDWTGAARARAAVVALDDTDPAAARYLLARAQHRAGEVAGARKHLLEALELAPMYDEALELLLRMREPAGRS